MRKLEKNILLLLTIFFITNVFSQTGEYVEVRDMEAWSSVELKYKLNKKWAFGLQEQLRLKEDVSVVDSYFTQLEASYSLTNQFVLGGGFRYISSHDNKGAVQGYDNFLRFQIDAIYKHKINDFSFKYRLRYQNKNELGVSVSEGDYASQHIRLKAGIGYNIKGWKLDPKFSAEIYNHFEKSEENNFNKFRMTVGTDYNLKSYGEIGVFYRMEKQLNTDYPKTSNIIGLKYVYTIKNNKAKKTTP
jgi:hypothetical protein